MYIVYKYFNTYIYVASSGHAILYTSHSNGVSDFLLVAAALRSPCLATASQFDSLNTLLDSFETSLAFLCIEFTYIHTNTLRFQLSSTQRG